MKLILQAIKALFRKVEYNFSTLHSYVDSKVSAESKKLITNINNVRNRVADVADMAAAANTKANNAQTAAKNAQTTANNAQAAVNAKPSVYQASYPDAIEGLFDLNIGERISTTRKGKVVNLSFKKGDIIVLDFQCRTSNSVYILYPLLYFNTTGGAEGIYTHERDGDFRVFTVQFKNYSTNSSLAVVRIA